MPFVKGQSGNPGGRRKRTKEEEEALELLKAKSPALMKKAIEVATRKDHDSKVLVALINKICPETLKLEADSPLMVMINKARRSSDGTETS